MYRIMLVADQCQEENQTLSQLISLNDSLSKENEKAKTILKQQLDLKTGQYENEQLKYQQAEGKYSIANESLAGMTRKKNIYMGTTIVGAILILISIMK